MLCATIAICYDVFIAQICFLGLNSTSLSHSDDLPSRTHSKLHRYASQVVSTVVSVIDAALRAGGNSRCPCDTTCRRLFAREMHGGDFCGKKRKDCSRRYLSAIYGGYNCRIRRHGWESTRLAIRYPGRAQPHRLDAWGTLCFG